MSEGYVWRECADCMRGFTTYGPKGDTKCVHCREADDYEAETKALRAQVSTLTARLEEVEAETLERAAKAVCSYVGRCNSNRCPCQTIRSLASKKGTDNG